MAISTDDIRKMLEVMKSQGVGAFKLDMEGIVLEVSFTPEVLPLPDPADEAPTHELTEDQLRFYSSG